MRGRPPRLARTRAKPKPWYEQDAGKRLATDWAVVEKCYPGLSYRVDDAEERVYLEGALLLALEQTRVRTDIQVRIEFPPGYPLKEPRAYDSAGRFPHIADRHFFPDGRCCLWLPPESQWDRAAPDGLCRYLDQVALFFYRQLLCDALSTNGRVIWPGKARAHGDLGYVEYVLDLLDGDEKMLDVLAPALGNTIQLGRNDRCPCGSGIKYKRCHLEKVADIERRVGASKLHTVFRGLLGDSASSEKATDHEP